MENNNKSLDQITSLGLLRFLIMVKETVLKIKYNPYKELSLLVACVLFYVFFIFTPWYFLGLIYKVYQLEAWQDISYFFEVFEFSILFLDVLSYSIIWLMAIILSFGMIPRFKINEVLVHKINIGKNPHGGFSRPSRLFQILEYKNNTYFGEVLILESDGSLRVVHQENIPCKNDYKFESVDEAELIEWGFIKEETISFEDLNKMKELDETQDIEENKRNKNIKKQKLYLIDGGKEKNNKSKKNEGEKDE